MRSHTLLFLFLSLPLFADDDVPGFHGIQETLSGGSTYDGLVGMGGVVDDSVLSRYSQETEDGPLGGAPTAGPYVYSGGPPGGQNLSLDFYAEIRRHRKAYAALPEIKSEVGALYKIDYQLFKAPAYNTYDNLRDLMKEKFFRD